MIIGVERKNKIANLRKGFTLVELIVVLVILAILAAVAIPLMLGFTDDAREKRYKSDANAALQASQTVITEVYNEGGNLLDGTKRYKAWSMSGVDEVDTFDSASCTSFTVWTGKQLETNKTVATSDNISSYTIVCAKFVTSKKDGKKVLFYDGKEWEVFDDESALEVNTKYNSLVSASEYGNNKIQMWPNSPGCDSAYKTVAVNPKDWYDHDNPPIIVQKIKLHGYKQNGGGVYFISDEYLTDDTPAKRNYDTLEVAYKFDGVRREVDWESARKIKTGYTIKVDGEAEGYYEFIGWADSEDGKGTIYTEDEINSDDFIARVRSGEITDLYAKAYQTYDTVQVNLKAYDPNTLGFGTDAASATSVKSVIFRKYKNTEADYSKNNQMINSGGEPVLACSLGQIDEDVILKGGDNYTFGGWAFYPSGYNGSNGSDYEKEEGTAPARYTSIADLWEKVFSSATSTSGGTDETPAVQNFDFVGVVQKTQTINLHADANSKFKKSGSLAIYYFHRFEEMAPNNHADTFDEYEENKLLANPSYRHKGWKGQVGSSTVSLSDTGITEIRNTVAANSQIDEFDFTADVVPSSRTKFVGSTFVGQILDFAGQRDGNTVLFTKKKYDDAVSIFKKVPQISSMIDGLSTPEQEDDVVKSGATGTVISINGLVSVEGGYLDKFAILWDGKDDVYDIPSFAYSVVKSNKIEIYWTSRDETPLLDGDFSYAFQGYSAMSFAGCGADAWNTSECTDMAHMFDGCGIGNTQITFGNWDYSKVESMAYMFDSVKLTNIDLSGKTMDRVTSMEGMFRNATDLTAVSMSGVSATSLESTKNMFAGCTSIDTVSLAGINTSKTLAPAETTGSLTDTSYMFSGCVALSNFDISGLDTSSVTTMASMFENCSSLNSTLDLSSFKTSKVETMASMFAGCNNLPHIKLNHDNFVASDKLITVEKMFMNCQTMTYIDLTGFGSCTNLTSIASWFENCYHLKCIYLNNLSTSSSSLKSFNRVFKHAGDNDPNERDFNLHLPGDGCAVFATGVWEAADVAIPEEADRFDHFFRIDLYGTVYKEPRVNATPYGMGNHGHFRVEPENNISKVKDGNYYRLTRGYFNSTDSLYYTQCLNQYPLNQ